MHLIIQIPCYNEAETLPQTFADLPAQIPGITRLETLVIDDGSTDETVAVAEALGADYIICHAHNRGLATVFETGLTACLRLGADIIVNTDGDNQYPGHEIPRLIEPILQGQADIVIGDRQTHTIAHFSLLKRFLQRWGSWIVRLASGTAVSDATSGFRAFSRDAALQLTIFTKYTYTLETIIQAGKKGLLITSIPIQTNTPLRQSRLVKSNWSYVKRNAATILRIYTFYEPLRTFFYLSLFFLVPGLFLIGRFMILYFSGLSAMGRYVQSVVIGGTLTIVGALVFILGVMADLNAANRRLSEDVLYHLKRLEINGQLENQSPQTPKWERLITKTSGTSFISPDKGYKDT